MGNPQSACSWKILDGTRYLLIIASLLQEVSKIMTSNNRLCHLLSFLVIWSKISLKFVTVSFFTKIQIAFLKGGTSTYPLIFAFHFTFFHCFRLSVYCPVIYIFGAISLHLLWHCHKWGHIYRYHAGYLTWCLQTCIVRKHCKSLRKLSTWQTMSFCVPVYQTL